MVSRVPVWDTPGMRYAALLRGVNLGATRKVPMAELRDVLEEEGFEEVQTYLRSGNVAFRSDHADRGRLRGHLEDMLAGAFGFDIPLVLVDAGELAAVVESNPYLETAAADPTKVHVTFLERALPRSAWDSLAGEDFGEEEFVVGERWLYMHLPHGMGRASLPAALDRVTRPVVVTTRNWRTVLRLAELVGG